jgi:hypothetical protein
MLKEEHFHVMDRKEEKYVLAYACLIVMNLSSQTRMPLLNLSTFHFNYDASIQHKVDNTPAPAT